MDKQEHLKKIIGAIQELPTLPTVAMKINNLIKSPTAGAGDLARLIEFDQSITANLLSLVNSAYYGLSRKISTVQDAVAYLGTNTVSQIVLGLGVLKTFQGKDSGRFDREKFWHHSMGVAVLARKMAKNNRLHKQPEDVFTAGLLHDLGKVALDHFCADSFKLVLDELEKGEVPFHHAEMKTIGVDHARVGEWVARNWQLPLMIVVAIRHHHELPGERTGFHLSEDKVVDLIAIADWLAVENSIGNSGSGVVEEPVPEIFDRAGISREDAISLSENAAPEIEAAAKFLGI